MKQFKLLFALTATAALALLTAPPLAAQITDYKPETFTGVQSSVAASSAASPTNSTIRLAKNLGGVGIWSSLSSEDAATGDVTLKFALSYDGTNWSTTTYNHVVALSGTNVVVGHTNFPATVVGSARHLKLLQISNGSASNLTVNAVTAARYLTP